MGVSFSQECVDPYVDNATFVVSQQAASNSFEGGETIKATAVSSNICVGKGETKSNSAFAFPISADDSVLTPNKVDGATKEEKFYIESNGQSLKASFEKDESLPIQRTSTTFKTGSLYVVSEIKKLAADSSQIGFETDTLYVNTDSAEVGVNVTLPVADTLSGIQFDLVFDGPKPIVTKSHDKGTLNTNLIAEDTLRVLLYSGLSEDVLPKQNVVNVNADVTSGGQTIDIINGVASLKQSEVSLNPGVAPVYIQQGNSQFVVETGSVSFSETIVGNESQESILVENTGTVPLELQTQSDNGVFEAETGILVSPGDTKEVTSNFLPKRNKFGDQSGSIELTTESDTASVSVDGLGVGGRGDPTFNGQVNVGDITKTSDIILQQGDLTNNQIQAADVYPVVDEGDGTVTVTDLQTIANAILNGNWTDGEPIFEGQTSSTQTFAKAVTQNQPNAFETKIVLKEKENKTEIHLQNPGSARGLQFDVSTQSPISVAETENVKIQTGQPESGIVRTVVYRTDGKSLSSLKIGTVDSDFKGIKISNGILAGQNHFTSKIKIVKKPLVTQNSLEVYPNPTAENANIELRLKNDAEGSLKVFDVLGREIETVETGKLDAGRKKYRLDTSEFSSGVYFVILEGGNTQIQKKFTVVK